ncbi:AAA family ATPase [Viscerimonas tarda]
MIISFSIQNFGSIKDKQTLSFEADKSTHLEDYYVVQPIDGLRLLKLGLIYGANASGKTTVLKALDFLRGIVLQPKEKKTDTFDFKPFLFDMATPKQNTIFSIEFIQSETRYSYKVELNEKAIVREELYSYNPKKSNVFTRTTDIEVEATKVKFGNKINIDKNTAQLFENITLWNNTVLGGFLKINFFAKELKDVIDWFRDYLFPNRLALSHNYIEEEMFEANKNIILDIIRKADFNISNIIVKPRTIDEYSSVRNIEDKKALEGWVRHQNEMGFKDIKFQHSINSKNYLLDFNDESDGTKKYYRMAGVLFLLIKSSKAFSIDELEASLHPDLFVHFLLSFLVNSKKSQLIATTHNREILNNRDIFRNDVIWITDKYDNCATELYSIADFDTSVIRDTSNIYNAYKIGKLGGVPDLGDYYIDDEEK